MQFNLQSMEIDPDAARQYIDARSAFTEMERTKKMRCRCVAGWSGKPLTTRNTSFAPAPLVRKKVWVGDLQKPRLSTKVSKRKSRPWTSVSAV
jgi:hypothetical protein